MCFSCKRIWFRLFVAAIYLSLILLLPNQEARAQPTDGFADTSIHSARTEGGAEHKEVKGPFIYQLGLEYRPAWVIPSDPFFKTDNAPKFSPGFAQSGHLQYGFGLPESSLGGQVFRHTYQGIGVALFDFGNRKEIGRPLVIYLFQKSGLTRISSRFSIDYEWNFGLSTGWVLYNPRTNPNNIVVGSRVNAYINLAAYTRWQIDQQWSMKAGIDFTHFSNGNTEYPNAGVNLPGIRLGLAYDISKHDTGFSQPNLSRPAKFTRFLSYDMVIFGSWRKKGVKFLESEVASPDKYPVVGAYFAPMYNWGYRFRSGLSLDLLYDGSANVYTEDYIAGTEQQFFTPRWDRQVGLGLSGRVDYVMPLFTVGLGIGTFVLHKGGDMRGTYQAFSLKVRTSKNSFAHIGYNIKNFHEPNYLMLGFGYRFNNKAPSLLAR